MTDPMPTLREILYPPRTNTPDHHKIAENLLSQSEQVHNDILATKWAEQASAHALLDLADRLQHIHDDLGVLLDDR